VIDHGIEYIETAANYGRPKDTNRSERRIGPVAPRLYLNARPTPPLFPGRFCPAFLID
jgi:hypothetical protein